MDATPTWVFLLCYRILGDDFTLFHGYTLESTIPKGHFTVLTASFENLNRGGLFVELIDVLDKTASEVVKYVLFYCIHYIDILKLFFVFGIRVLSFVKSFFVEESVNTKLK